MELPLILARIYLPSLLAYVCRAFNANNTHTITTPLLPYNLKTNMPKGIVTILNHRRGMYAVELADGSYSVFELLDTNEINLEDIISGALDEEGSCTLKNLSENEEFDAMVQNIGLNLIMAKSRTMLT